MSLENFFTFDNLRGLPIDPKPYQDILCSPRTITFDVQVPVHRYSKACHVVSN